MHYMIIVAYFCTFYLSKTLKTIGLPQLTLWVNYIKGHKYFTICNKKLNVIKRQKSFLYCRYTVPDCILFSLVNK